MAFLNPPEILAWMTASLEASGFRSLAPLPQKIWKDAVRHGKNALPPGFFGILWERLTHTPAGVRRERDMGTGASLSIEQELLDIVARSPGFEHLEGLFALHGAKSAEGAPDPSPEGGGGEFAASVLAGLLDRLPGFHHPLIQITAQDLESALEQSPHPRPLSQRERGGASPTPRAAAATGRPTPGTVAASPFPAARYLQTVYQDALDRLTASPLALSPVDLFEIGHPNLFHSPADRTFYRRMMDGATGIAPWAAGSFTLKEDSTTVVAQFGEPQILPLGGYDSLTTRGDISSLLSSELGFIDEEMAVDLFDLKYCENQLLYFKREEGAVFRIRRDLLIDLELTAFFEHERHLGLLFAWCFVLVVRLMETFVKDALRIFFRFSGFTPSAFKDACAFFRYFLEEKGISDRIFLSSLDDPPDDFQSARTQGWRLGGPPDQENPPHAQMKHVPLEFPQTDEFAAAEAAEQERRLGLLLLDVLKRMIGHADR